MSHPISMKPVAHLVDPNDVQRFDILGPVVEYFTPPREGEPCIMGGTIPPGVSVPLHAHADPETFLMISGEVEGLRRAADGFDWIAIRPGDVFHVPGGAKHAFRNRKNIPAVMMIVSTDKIGRFFQEVGSPAFPESRPASITLETIRHFLDASARYGYWNAAPEENERIGIAVPAA